VPRKSVVGAYLASIGRKGGKTTTPAKAAAARKNGKKGGRPRKRKQAKERT